MSTDIAAIREHHDTWAKYKDTPNDGSDDGRFGWSMHYAPSDRAALLALLDEAAAALRDALNPLTYRLPEEANAAIGAIETVLAKLEGK